MSPTLAHWLLWLPGCVALASALSQLAAPRGWRRWLTLGLALGSLALPWLAPSGSVLRGMLALYLFWACAKLVDMLRDPLPRSPLFRWIWMLVPHDLRRDGYARRGARREFRPALLASAVGMLALAFGALLAAMFGSSGLAPGPRWVARLAAGIVACYFGVDGLLRLFELVERALGLAPPQQHDRPILSLSLAEFWGRRWNRVVGHWLFATFYRPLARRGRPVAGVSATFAASAALHAYFTCAAIGWRWAVPMAAFFALQAPLVLLEPALGQPRWPTPWRRFWTLGCLLVTSPLFVAPTLVTLEGGFR